MTVIPIGIVDIEKVLYKRICILPQFKIGKSVNKMKKQE